MGCYGIGTGRLLSCIIEQHHDEYGIVWPVSVAPFQVHLVSIGTNKPEIVAAADSLYDRLVNGGYDVLYDDRDDSAGVKFNDADLIGIPVRLTVSAKTLAQDSVEVKARWAKERQMVDSQDLEGAIDALLANKGGLQAGG